MLFMQYLFGMHYIVFILLPTMMLNSADKDIYIFSNRKHLQHTYHHGNSNSYNDSAGLSNMQTRMQSKVSSTIGNNDGGRLSKKKDQAHVTPPTIQAFDQKAKDYFNRHQSKEELMRE